MPANSQSLQAIFSAMGEGLFVVSRDGYRITQMNEAAGRILCLQPNQIIGKDAKEIIQVYKDGLLLPPAERPVMKTFTTGLPISAGPKENYSIKTAGRPAFPISITTTPLTRNGQVTAAVIVFRDTSQEVQLSKQLQKERDQAQAVISSMGEGLLVIDLNHRITQINPAALKLLELSSKQAQGQVWSKVVIALHENGIIPILSRSFAQTLVQGKSLITTPEDNHYYRTLSGKTFPVASITTPLLENGKPIGAIKVFRDVTAEKHQQAVIETQVKQRTRDLLEEQTRLTASLNSLDLGFVITDPAENIILTNPSVSRILNFSSPPTNFHQIETLLQASCDLHQLHQTCRSSLASINLPNVVFGSLHLHLFLAPIVLPPPNSEYIGTALVIEDITEAKILERSKDEFFSIASHELRTPLTAIRGNTSLILDHFGKALPDPMLTEMLGDIHESSIRLIGIVNDFLNLSRLEQGQIQFNHVTFDLLVLLHEIVQEFSQAASQKNLTLSVAKPAHPSFFVTSDHDRVKEVLVNLIGNALKYTDSGSITLTYEPKDTSVKILVSDTGRGIPLSQQPLLFHKFQQAGESLYTRDTTKGTGLGLYISKLIIGSLGGQIGLQSSTPGEGSTFYFTLPML